MAVFGEVHIPYGEIVKDATIKVRVSGFRLGVWRLRLACWLIRLAARVAGCGIEFI